MVAATIDRQLEVVTVDTALDGADQPSTPFLDVEQIGEVGVNHQQHRDAQRLGAEVSQHDVFTHAVGDQPAPLDDYGRLGAQRPGCGSTDERAGERLAHD